MESRSPEVNNKYQNSKQGTEIRYYAITSGAHIDLNNSIQEIKTTLNQANMIINSGKINGEGLSEIKSKIESLEQGISGSLIKISEPITTIQTNIKKGNVLTTASFWITLLSLILGILSLVWAFIQTSR